MPRTYDIIIYLRYHHIQPAAPSCTDRDIASDMASYLQYSGMSDGLSYIPINPADCLIPDATDRYIGGQEKGRDRPDYQHDQGALST